jgi:DNA-binding beta-propeller fold protein YncE
LRTKVLFSNDCDIDGMTRRQCLAWSGTVLWAACGRKKGSGYPGYAVIAASGDKSIAVIDLLAFRLTETIPLDSAPSLILSSPRSNKLYVLTPETGSVHLLAPNWEFTQSRRLGPELSKIKLSATGEHLVGISGTTRELVHAEANSLNVVHRYRLAGTPFDLDLATPDLAAISTGETGVVELFHLSSRQRRQYQFPGPIGSLRFRTDGELILVANAHGRSLTALSVPDLKVVAELPLAMEPKNLCFNSDGGQLFITGEGMDGVAIIFPYRVLQVEQTVLAGRDPGVMAVSENPAYLFVGSASGSDVCIMNINTRKLVGIVDVAQQPGFMTVTPDSQYALVLDRKTGNMAVIHISAFRLTGEAARTKSGAALFTLLPVGNEPVYATVVPAHAA